MEALRTQAMVAQPSVVKPLAAYGQVVAVLHEDILLSVGSLRAHGQPGVPGQGLVGKA